MDSKQYMNAVKTANELTDHRFGSEPKYDPWQYGLLSCFLGWLVASFAFFIADVPRSMIGYTPDVAGVCVGLVAFISAKIAERRRSKFWADAFIKARESE